MASEKLPTRPYEDFIDIIDVEIAKRRNKWNLKSLAWIGWDDIAQIIRIHIFQKWAQYDQSKPIHPWLNTVISHQFYNLIRNNYTNYARPCTTCKAAQPDDGCSIYSKQCSACPAFSEWEKKKKAAYNIKLPLSMEYHEHEVKEIPQEPVEEDANIAKVHSLAAQVLKPHEYLAYKKLYIELKSEEQTASELGYTTSEKKRFPGYKQIKNIQKSIITKLRKKINKEDGSYE